jgi:hypothetical protein
MMQVIMASIDLWKRDKRILTMMHGKVKAQKKATI